MFHFDIAHDFSWIYLMISKNNNNNDYSSMEFETAYMLVLKQQNWLWISQIVV